MTKTPKTPKTAPKPRRVWIEFEYPKDGNAEEGRAIALTASRMLWRLGYTVANAIFWSEREKRFCVTTDTGGSYQGLQDNGHWFSLDFFGREIENPPMEEERTQRAAKRDRKARG